ncbi:DUF6538 domain-containing protein [Sinorhizobium fredii]|uniref:DUF6538 domain-containing protein n=1 Tax=Rhizobium fredii TaxID=380 RepID=UPI0004B1EE58|nr:DUF6538 domain-containing protein [Sinorhizobium fredii]AWI60367.1 hypothetical protein AB395_00005190 [Sinorhizobium fredii CCBAU 45436]
MTRNYGSYLQERNGTYYFLFTVPKDQIARFGGKRQVRKSLGTKDRKQALIKLGPLIEQHMKLFHTPDTNALTFDHVKEAAGYLGFGYRPAQEFQAARIEERVEMLAPIFSALKLVQQPNANEKAAIVGAVEVAALTFKQAFERFKELSPEKVKGKNPVEAKRFWRRYEKIVEDFTDAMGDRDVLKLTKNDAKEYRKILKQSVVDGGFKSDAAKKKLDWLGIVLDVVFDEDYEGKENPFRDVKISGFDDDAARPPFTEAELTTIRVAREKSGMRPEAKAIIRIGECTGANAKELALMQASDIHLDCEIPYISIRPNGLRNRVKRGGKRHRDIPLVGDALAAMQEYPQGFTVYHSPQGPDQINSAMSDFFRNVTPGKGFGSYRHTMADWLRRSGSNDTLKDSILGHTTKGHSMHYGAGYELENKKEALEKALEYAKQRMAKAA